jgi:hypothetical protein
MPLISVTDRIDSSTAAGVRDQMRPVFSHPEGHHKTPDTYTRTFAHWTRIQSFGRDTWTTERHGTVGRVGGDALVETGE